MPSKTSKSSSTSSETQDTTENPVKYYESHLIFKSQWEKVGDNEFIEHRGEKLKLRPHPQQNSTTLSTDDELVAPDGEVSADQIEAKAAAAAYLTPRSDIPKEWQSIKNELNSRRHQEAAQMKIENPPLLSVQDVKADFARSFVDLITSSNKSDSSSDSRSSGSRGSSESRGRHGSKHRLGSSRAELYEWMFLEGFSFAYEVHGAFLGSGWASRHTYCFKSAQELESSEAYWDELQTNSDDVAMRRLVSEHRVEGVGFTLVVDEVETVSGARIGSRETSISLCVLSPSSSTPTTQLQDTRSYFADPKTRFDIDIDVLDITMSGTAQETTRFTPREELMIFDLRGKINWNSRFKAADPAEASIDESDPHGPRSFEVIAQLMTFQRREHVTAEAVKAGYSRMLSENLVNYDRMLCQLKESTGIADSSPQPPPGVLGALGFFGGHHKSIQTIHQSSSKGRRRI
ncbi:MAG: hypothetical protein Q9199_002829 [Rusavskia elegans]